MCNIYTIFKYVKELFYTPIDSVRHPENKFRQIAEKTIPVLRIRGSGYIMHDGFENCSYYMHSHRDYYDDLYWGHLAVWDDKSMLRCDSLYFTRKGAIIALARQLQIVDEELARDKIKTIISLKSQIHDRAQST